MSYYLTPFSSACTGTADPALLKCFVRHTSQPYLFYQHSSAVSKSPTKAQQCLKTCTKSRIIWPTLQLMRKTSPWFAALPLLPLLRQCIQSPGNRGPAEPGQSLAHLPHHRGLLLQRQGCRACTGNTNNMIYARYGFLRAMVLHSRRFGWGFVPPVLGEECRRNRVNGCDVVSGGKPTSCFIYLKWSSCLLPAQTPAQGGQDSAPGMETTALFSALSHTPCVKGVLPFFLGGLEDKSLPGRIHFYFSDVAVRKV